MYNRYIPGPNGSYQKNRIPEPSCCSSPAQDRCSAAPSPPQAQPAGSFLKNLLPGDLDTGDLLVLAVLLLIAGDSSRDRGSVLLTLALYFLL